jgi:hypothetical protein
MSRLPSRLWVQALIRRAELGGASAFIAARGDAERGDLAVKVALLDGTARLYRRGYASEGERPFDDVTPEQGGEADCDAQIARWRARDEDLWVIEIEDRQGRHFLTEMINPRARS